MYAESSSAARGHAHRSQRSRISNAIGVLVSWSREEVVSRRYVVIFRRSNNSAFPWSRHVGTLLRFIEQLAADQHPPDLRRSRADFIQLGISPQASHRIIVDVSVTAERLDCLAGHPRRLLGCVEYRTGRVLARSLPAIARL